MFPKKFMFSRILLGFLRFTRPLKASPGEDGRWGGEKRGDGGDPSLWVLQAIVRPRSTGLALWVFSHMAGDNKSQHDFLTPPPSIPKMELDFLI